MYSWVAQWQGICLPRQETWVGSLVREDPLEKEMATHSRILAWRIPQTEEPGRLQSRGLQRVRHNLTTEHACTRKLKITFVAHLVCTVCIYVKQNCSRVVVVG